MEYPISTLGLSCISIGNNFNVRKDFKLRAHQEYENIFFSPERTFSDNFHATTQSNIMIVGKLVIGNNATLSSSVGIIDHAHS